jgi:hypothetical protein
VLRLAAKWMQNNHLSCQEAFRVVDRGFDGFISLQDL